MSSKELVQKSALAREIGICSRTLSRWIGDAAMQFPRPCVLRNRLYFERSEIEAWMKDRLRGTANPSSPNALSRSKSNHASQEAA